MERIKKGEKYWHILIFSELKEVVCTIEENFNTKEEAVAMAEKIRKVLKGAEVIEMPSEEELKQKADEHALSVFYKYNDEEINEQTCKDSFLESIEWLKSKIVK